jgi:hypothetical protein
MSNFAGPNTTKSILALNLDAANKKSYPGTGTTWTDLKGKFPFFPSGATNPIFSPLNGGNFQLDGTGYYVNNNAILGTNSPTNLCSASIWFKSSDNTKDFQYIFNFTNGWGILSRSGVLNATRNSLTLFTTLPYSITQDQWYHTTMVTNSASNISVYINGQLIVGPTGIATMTAGSTFLLGKNLVGNIGHFTFYKGRVLTEKEVYNNYVADKARYGL